MGDNDKTTCPVCFTKMKMVNKVLTCPECGYKYCDHNRADIYDVSHTHTPDYTTYNKVSGNEREKTPEKPLENYPGNHSDKEKTPFKKVKMIVLIFVIINFLSICAPLFARIFSLFLMGTEILSPEYEGTAETAMETVAESNDLPEELMNPFETDFTPISLEDEEGQFLPDLIKHIFETESLDTVTVADISQISSLYIRLDSSGCYYAEYFRPFVGLEDYHSECTNLRTSDLKVFCGLHFLDVTYLPLEKGDLTELAYLQGLQCSTPPCDLKEVLDPQSLTYLDLYLPEGTTDIDGIEEFTSLEYLSIDAMAAHVEDLSAVTRLPNLLFLYYDSYSSLQDFDFLYDLTDLKTLHLTTSGLHDIDFLYDYTALEGLELCNTSVVNWAPLTSVADTLTSLTIINDTTNPNFTPISELSYLTYLDLEYDNLEDISFLSDLTTLTMLRLDHNSITSLEPLQDLPNLTYLSVSENPIKDYAGLRELVGQ